MPAALAVKKTRTRTPVDLRAPHALGRYVTMVTCAECHGPDLNGGGDTPDLVVASAYTRTEFETLMTEGIPIGPRKLGLMAEVAKHRFSRLTKGERDALYGYLKARAERPQ
jgi:mono/diheme cytochrome c family protein